MFDFDKHLADLKKQTVLCVGDLMLDEFVYGEVSRISPEAPALVIAAKRSETMIGGAGNVARNIASLGARCIFVGVVGDDEAGRSLKKALRGQRRVDARLVTDKTDEDAARAQCGDVTSDVACTADVDFTALNSNHRRRRFG